MIRVLLIFLLSVFLFSSCSANNTETGTTQTKNVKEINNTPIKIYRFEFDTTIKNAIGIFRSKYKDVDINETVFDKDSGKEYRERLQTEIMAGEGPDVIIFQLYFNISLRKIADTGVLCDLNPLFSEDDELKADNFNKAVFDCGVINNKRYFVPVSYTVPVFWTTDKILSDHGIEVNLSDWSLQELDKNVRDFTDHFGKDKFFTDNPQDIIESMVLGSGLQLVDYEKKKTYFNTDEFKELLQYVKNMEKVLCSFETETKYRNSYYDMLKEGSLLSVNGFLFTNILHPTELWMANSQVYSMMDENIRIIPFPEYYGKKEYGAKPITIVAINNNCKNKKAAVDFIKILLSKDFQARDSFQSINGIPINNFALEELLDKYSDEQTGSQRFKTNDGWVAGIPFTDAFAGGFLDIINNVKPCNFVDTDVWDLIGMYAYMYALGECSEEEAISQLDRKVTLYLNE